LFWPRDFVCTQCGEERLICEYTSRFSRCDYPLEVAYDLDEMAWS
jgi:hypothetical protein